MLVKIPYYNISPIKAFALEGWTLGKTHGLPHWQRVERNAILLSLKEYNGSFYLRKEVNIMLCSLMNLKECHVSSEIMNKIYYYGNVSATSATTT